MSIDAERARALRGTFPGPSRTITVEPVQVPTSPGAVPTVPPKPLPPPRETESPREPVPAQ